MSPFRSYLDYNATAPLRPAARDAMVLAMETAGNPSSIHAEGRAARVTIEAARRSVASLVEAAPDRVTFVSGATEAAATALSPALHRRGGSRDECARLLVLATDHACVLQGHRFPATRTSVLPVDGQGRIRLEALDETLRADGPALVAVQAANNETGVVQPIGTVADLVHAAGGLLVSDAVQAVGKMPLAEVAQADALLVSAHKLGGPTGVGALILGADIGIGAPLIGGGGQERGQRSGTENVVGVAGFGAAVAAVGSGEQERFVTLRDRFEAGLRALSDEVVIFGSDAERLPNTTSFSFGEHGPGAETLLMALDLSGVSVSSGSACSSGKVGRSHVLEAMGVRPDIGWGAIRVSVGWASVEADIDRCLEAIGRLMRRMQSRCVPAAA